MSNIYNITTEFLQLEAQLIENGGELTPELETALIINKDELQHKSIQYGYVIKSLSDNVDAIDNEINRLQAIKKTNENAIDRLKDTLSSAMQLFGIPELKTPTLKINFRKSEQVVVNDVNALPSDYKTIKVTEQADKIKIKQAIKSGEDVIGCELITVQNLQIK
jgi:hypothetical protein